MREVELVNRNSEPTINLALDTIDKRKQALVFVNTKRSAEKVAEDIAGKLQGVPEMEEFAERAENVLGSPTKQCLRLGKCLRKGIAFHHAGLHQKQKEMIEKGFRDGDIRIIACTPTLAAGLDLPAFRAIIRDLKRHGGVWGMTPIPVLEYHQMAGRAGRPGKDDYSEAITIAKSIDDVEDIKETYIDGKPESIYSKLAVEPVLRTYILSLIASGFVNTEKSVIEFFSRTFWAKQYKDMNKLSSIILKMIDLLEGYGFIFTKRREEISVGKVEKEEKEEDPFVSADNIEDEAFKKENEAFNKEDRKKENKIRATPLGKRVAELYLDPYTANHLITCLRDSSEMGEVPLESYIHMISHTIEMRPLVRMRKKTEEYVSDFLMMYEDKLFEQEPSMYDEGFQEFYDSVNTTLFFRDWMEETDEEVLLEKYGVRPGETRYKLDSAEWLLYASVEFCKIMGLREIQRTLNKLIIRIKYGVKEELLPLLKFRNVGRVRARKLFDNGIKDIGDVKKASLTTLSQIVGSKIAQSLKEQMGDETEEISDRKLKGQMAIGKYSKK
ncbi:MAG: helicase-related protein [Nanoarchaeota archaeon]